MTRCLRAFAGAFLALLLLATGVTLAQGQPGSAKVGPRPNTGNANPAAAKAPAGNAPAAPAKGNAAAPQPAQPKAPDPRLEILLKNWEVSSSKIKSLHGKHIRSRSNSVFGTDARATGEFYFEAPDKGRIDLKGDTPKEGAVSALKLPDGTPYKLIAEQDEKWVCDGKQVIVINDKEKQYEAIPIPAEMQGEKIIESPLPFLFGMKVADAKKRFDMDLLGVDNEKMTARIKVIPLQARDAQNFMRAEIELDIKNYVPVFVSLTDPAGTITTRYIFKDLNINKAGIVERMKGIWGNDPFKPDLRSYKKVQPPPVQQAGGAAPQNGAGNKINQTGVKVPATTPLPRTTLQSPGAGSTTKGQRPGVK